MRWNALSAFDNWVRRRRPYLVIRKTRLQFSELACHTLRHLRSFCIPTSGFCWTLSAPGSVSTSLPADSVALQFRNIEIVLRGPILLGLAFENGIICKWPPVYSRDCATSPNMPGAEVTDRLPSIRRYG